MIPVSRSERLASRLVAVFVAVVFLTPAAMVLWASIHGDDGFTLRAYRPLWTELRPWRLFCNSIAVSTIAAALATAAGTISAIAAYSLRPRLGIALLALATAPILIPPYIAATAWIEWAGNRGVIRTVFLGSESGDAEWFSLYGIGGVSAVLAGSYYPVVMLFAWVGLARTGRRVVEAAWVAMGPRRVLWRVMLPNARAGMATGAFVVFMMALANYSVPSLLLVDVYPVEVYAQFSAFYDVQRATAAFVPMLATAAAGAVLWRCYVRRQQLPNPDRPATRLQYYAPVQPVPMIVTFGVVLVAVVMPLVVLAGRAGSWSSYWEVYTTAREELATSLVLAAATATALLILGWLLAALVHASRAARWANRGMILPFVLSGSLYAIGLILLYNRPGMLGAIYDSIAIVVMGCCARYLFFGAQAGAAALSAVPASLSEAAAVSGQPWWRRQLLVDVPLTAPWMVATWGIAFILAFGEADAVMLLAPPGVTPLPARLHSLMHYGPSAYVAALSLTVVAVLALAAVTLCVVFVAVRRGVYARSPMH